MLDWLAKLNRPYVQVREGTRDDAPFIANLIAEGAADGHFDPAFAPGGDMHATLAHNAGSALSDRRWFTRLDPPESVGARVYVYTARYGPIGFLMAGAADPEATEHTLPSIAIHMMAFQEDYRGKGCGSQLLDGFLERVPSDWRIEARCYATSVRMIGMLTRRGFRETGTTPGGAIVLVRGSTR
jgi:GNAT superfamily N-acetyltransferase